ncbi:ROK family transcriptional regulator [Oceanicola sp. 502str15]|uniref:ROK family transcriptional regulator n=1 Tax=Oceanicola sp. 502str15 TaxID=2696061 RepID=UPI0020955A1F|nr:ROK family transcriptional regulator [Oceanicola sp. 502str15]MCO6381414.1 ROK family protein [Oceanicola sp. 502str15]
MDGSEIKGLSGGVNQSGVRNYNERLVLSVLQRRGAMAGSDIARLVNLSPQTISIILRRLEADGIVMRGDPSRGKVGKPSIPMRLNPDGVLSVGFKVGRRSADLVLTGFDGVVRHQIQEHYDYPFPEAVFSLLERGLATFVEQLSSEERGRLCGIGIAAPFELWKWHDLVGHTAERFRSWKDIDFTKEVARFSDLPVFMLNDGTAACHAEHLYGRGKEFRDYAFVFVSSFIGGGVVLNNTVFEGNQGNAGALGSMRTTGPQGESLQLIDVASIHLLEGRLVEAGVDPKLLWQKPQDWSMLSRYVDPWMAQTAQELAKAALSVCSVIDFEAIVIDGAFPAEVRTDLVNRVRRYLVNQDTRGLIEPRIEAGSIGETARGIGAASAPIFSQFLLNANAGLTAY